MELVRHHNEQGHYMALVERTGTKWIRLLYIGDTKLKAVKKTEQRHMTSYGEATPVQIKQFRDSAKRRNEGKLTGLSKAVRRLLCTSQTSSPKTKAP
jgi:hypothetical protein